jgi:hypothetical protein
MPPERWITRFAINAPVKTRGLRKLLKQQPPQKHDVHVRIPVRDSIILQLTTAEVIEFNKDPDAWAGKHFGLTANEYRQWVYYGGTARCSEITTSGWPCNNPITGNDGYDLDAQTWKRMDGCRPCSFHRWRLAWLQAMAEAPYAVHH